MNDYQAIHESRAQERSGTGDSSNKSRSLVLSNVVPVEVHSNGCKKSPTALGPVSLPDSFSEAEARARSPRGASASVVEKVDESQSLITSQSSNLGNPPTIELEGSLRPRRRARETALAKIRQTQGQPKKRSKRPDSNLSPAAKRRKVPTNKANERTEASVEREEEKEDEIQAENALQVHEEVIPPIKGTHILSEMISTALTCILIVPAQKKKCMSIDIHPSNGPTASASAEVLDDPLNDLTVQDCVSDDGSMVSDGALVVDDVLVVKDGRLKAALRKQRALIKEMALTEAHIKSLRDGLNNWSNLTETARKMLGRYHTRAEIRMTLSLQEASLVRVKSEMNCIEYKIEGLRRAEGLTPDPRHIAEECQDADSAREAV